VTAKSPGIGDSLRSTAEWRTHRERGNRLLLRAMAFLSLRLGRTAGRCLLLLIVIYFFLFAPTARRHMRAYLRQALGRPPKARDRFRQLWFFSATILDRIYLLNGRERLFEVSVQGEALMRSVLAAGHGAFLMGAHVGSFEIIRAVGQSQEGLQVAMAMYEENARKLNSLLALINPAAQPEVIGLGHMDAMLKIREYLDRGRFVGILADRTLGAEPSLSIEFLGRRARFPVGPMRAAAILRRQVIFMIGLYRGGRTYHVAFEPLADFSNIEAQEREAAVHRAVRAYAALLERHCRSDPYNWFNFYDFWHDPDAHHA